ncbi:MAG TPA: DsbC family protein [Gammaproteobacteria bacterium]|nr:DsbC family protein [Gammaproteobacteria bacterium]
MRILSAAVVAAFISVTALADRAADEAAIRKALGNLEPASIEASPIAGLYEVVVGPHVIYMSADGRYMLQGELVDVQKQVNLTEPRRRQATRALMDNISEDDMIVFRPQKVKHTITVFTDIDCGYCRKLHSELQQYLDAGIEVRYMFFPRAGKGSPSYKKAVAVWCADDRRQALTDAKNGKAIEMKTCANPVDRHMQLVRQLGARGTPFIVLEDGSTQPGYVPAKPLARLLDEKSR